MTRLAVEESPALPRSIFTDPLDLEEEEYFDFVNSAMLEREPRIFSNGRPAHAVYLIFKFLETAERRIRICTGKLSRQFDGVLAYGDPVLARIAARFLIRGGALDIVMREAPDLDRRQELRDHPLLANIASEMHLGNGTLRVYRAPETGISFKEHFIVRDEDAARLEVDPATAKAYVSLRDLEVGRVLAGMFDNLLDDTRLLYSY